MILLTFDVLAELIRISSIFRPFFGLIRPGKKVVSAGRINQAESTRPNLPGRINMDSYKLDVKILILALKEKSFPHTSMVVAKIANILIVSKMNEIYLPIVYTYCV